ncbi:Peroxisomal fatty acid beta-oxidation multifunctional protein AIM1 [Morus notabilis]|uniref:Peroxisomal fatty acid beta-oxidation multifunctional protein AIM1 n=1 Tax=Morus notabilis TaxID=981085 RepID=W9RPA6_9ROSA|nr:Peroxisomal fatty acid beta-oxidation multifunctional protein AIM1 [Morus notabilis]
MARATVTMEVGNDGVAVIAISNPPVNALAIPIIAGLKEKFDEATRRNDVRAIVLTGKGGRFSGGFDINVFEKVHKTGDVSLMPDVSVDLVVNVIEDSKKPIVAAIEGLALGGGLELAMGCHARVSAPRAQLGLPELSLGIIPGFGGTQRLPRLIGLSKAVEMMLSSKPILSEEGKKLGLIDSIVSSEELLKVSRLWALGIAERRKPWLRSLHRTDKIGSLSEARDILKVARQKARKTAPNMPQHQVCLEVIEDGIVHGGYSGVLKALQQDLPGAAALRPERKDPNGSRRRAAVRYLCATACVTGAVAPTLGAAVDPAVSTIPKCAVSCCSACRMRCSACAILAAEARDFKKLVLSDTSKGLVHVFFAQRATSKVPKVTDIGLKPRPIKKVAIIGGGLMGSGIATAFILSNISVVLKEINNEYLLKGRKMIEANVQVLVSKGKLPRDKADKALSLLKGVLDYTEFRDVDMVIEAVIENISLKQTIFSEIEKACPSHCILASNTSTIDLRLVGEKTSSQDRILGAHFFSPAHVMPLLEIVRTEKTSPQVILDLMTVGKIIKKVPVVVGNCTGFAVNRTFFPYSQGAHILVNLGVDVFRIDRVITKFGLPLGPFQLQDLAGYGVFISTSKEFINAFPERTFKSPLIELLVQSGRNGKNNGKGYYIYEKGSQPKPDLTILPIIEESRQLTNIMPGKKPISVTDQEIVEMILFPVVNEACRVLEEGIVVRASDLDIASVLGMSFPSYRGGIVCWADMVGPRHVYSSLKKWSEAYGDFFKPSSLFNISDLRRTTLLLIVTLFPRFDDCECLSDGESGGKEPVGVKKTTAVSKNRWV